MIYGIGIDIVKIERLKGVVERWGHKFLERVFTKDEISYCYRSRAPYLSLSVRFAAKEAMIKAIGAEIVLSLCDIEITNSDTGKPAFRIVGKLQEIFAQKKIRAAHVSLSHERDYGVACVVLEL